MDLGLNGKVAVVTGASRGIGRGIAQAFAAEGARVAALARTADDLARTVDMLGAGLGAHLAVTCDVTDPEQAVSALDQVRSELGGLDILVNNAGRRQNFSRLDTLDMDEWRVAIEANLSLRLLHVPGGGDLDDRTAFGFDRQTSPPLPVRWRSPASAPTRLPRPV